MSSSNGLPCFPVWVDDSIRLVTIPGEHPAVTGARFNLWVASASGEVGPPGLLPDDDAILQPLSRLSPQEWKAMKPAIVKSWPLARGQWRIRRLLEEREKQAGRAAQAKQAGRLGGLAKAKKGALATAKRPLGSASVSLASEPVGKRARKRPSSKRVKKPTDATAEPSGLATASFPLAENPSKRLAPYPTPLKRGFDRKSCLSPETPSRMDGGNGKRPDSFSSHPDGEGENPPPDPRDETLEAIDALRRKILEGPMANRAEAVDRVLAKHISEGAPAETVLAALQTTIDHGPRDAAAYLSKILRIEVPNAHARSHEQAFAHVDSDGVLAALAGRAPTDDRRQ